MVAREALARPRRRAEGGWCRSATAVYLIRDSCCCVCDCRLSQISRVVVSSLSCDPSQVSSTRKAGSVTAAAVCVTAGCHRSRESLFLHSVAIHRKCRYEKSWTCDSCCCVCDCRLSQRESLYLRSVTIHRNRRQRDLLDL